MRIWILEIGEPLPIENGVRLHRYGLFSKWLAGQGCDVTWWTTSFSHAAKKNFVHEDCDKIIDGVTVKFVFSEGYRRNVSFARIRHNQKFAAFFKKQARVALKPDLIIAPIPIIEGAYEAVKFARECQIPILLDIRDLWPDELVDLAPWPLRPLAKLALIRAFKQMQYVCSNVTGIMGVSQSCINYGLRFANRSQNDNDFLFPLGYPDIAITANLIEQGKEWLKTLCLRQDSFKVCFFGTLGHYFDFRTVIKAVRELEKEFPVDLIIAGDGSHLEYYKKLARDLPYINFPGWVNAAQIACIMSICDAGLCCYKTDAKMALPNKPFEYMAGGLPIISSIQGELKSYLKKFNCGLTYQANSVRELADCIRFLRENPQQRHQMKVNSRNLFESHFTIDKVFQNAFEHFKKVYHCTV